MTKKYFITATDTDAGKTYFSELLTTSFVNLGLTVAVSKPISAGCELINGQLINEDAAKLLAASNADQTIQDVNPIAFAEPIAPHIAAAKHGSVIDENVILRSIDKLTGDIQIIEGAGGWRLPLGKGRFFSDIIKKPSIGADIILVVNMKLGCLNHAVLTYQSIISDGLNCVAWVANNQENMPFLKENIEELKQLFPMPCLGVLDFEPDQNKAIKNIDISTLN